MENEEKIIQFDLRGDDLKMINDIKDYIPTDREDIWGWLCYLENEIKGQLQPETNEGEEE